MKSIKVFAAISVLSLFAATGALAAGAVGGTTTTVHVTSGVTTTTGRPASIGPTFTGQPNQSCGSVTAPSTPGGSAVAPGSAFNPNGQSGTVYAGQQPQNSVNSVSVSQYDVACFRQP